MEYLAKHKDVIFLGQAVRYPGTAMSNTLENIPGDKLIELPVFEEVQMGMSLGLALDKKIPVSIFPRWNFLLCAVNQLVNHIDKLSTMSEFETKIIIRTGIGSERPLHPQAQHVGDFTNAFKSMLHSVEIVRLGDASEGLTAESEAKAERTDVGC